MRIASTMIVATAVAFSLVAAAAGRAAAQTTWRVSLDSADLQANGASVTPSMTPDGRFVAFSSSAPNLVAGDTNGFADIFVRDTLTGETSRVNVSSNGWEGNRDSGNPSISADGRYVAFTTAASTLIFVDSNNYQDVFVHDRQTALTKRVSVTSSGAQVFGPSYDSMISADGRYVAFSSSATNLVPNDRNGVSDVFVHDRQTGQTSIVSVSSTGSPGNFGSERPSISADGRFVAFSSEATGLDFGDTNSASDVFVHDRQTGKTSCVSVNSSGIYGTGDSSLPSITADGRFVAFLSDAANLVPDDTNGARDVFVHDRQTGETVRVSLDSAGNQGNGGAVNAPSISADGRFVAFDNRSTNLVSGDANNVSDAFIHDRLTGETTCVSVNPAGLPGRLTSEYCSISADGQSVSFQSASNDLVPNDSNGRLDVFVRHRVGCREGNVNAGVGAVTDVLFVNDSAGGPERTVRLYSYEPLTIFMDAPPSAARVAPFALYAWSTIPDSHPRALSLPHGIGFTCLPTPITGGQPAPRVVWNNTGGTLAGTPTLPSSPAPSVVLQRQRAFPRPANVFVQGLIRDVGAPNGRAAVTNGVAIEIR